MKIVTNWAANNRWKARLLIAIGGLTLSLMGLVAGMSLYWKGLDLDHNWIIVLAWTSLIIFYLFPDKKAAISGMLRRTCHIAIYALTFLLFMATGNHLPRYFKSVSTQNVRLVTFTTNDKRQQPKPTIKWNQSPRRSGITGLGLNLKDGLSVAVEHIQIESKRLPDRSIWKVLLFGGIATISLIWLLAQLSSGVYCSGIQLAVGLGSTLIVGVSAGAIVLLVMGIKTLAEQ
ncbi:MAG: hypothetical protein AAGG75_07060 [Bacteroidota bacterium]